MVDFTQSFDLYLETRFHHAFLRAFERSPLAPCLHRNVDVKVEHYALTVHLQSNENAIAALEVMEAEFKSGFRRHVERLQGRKR